MKSDTKKLAGVLIVEDDDLVLDLLTSSMQMEGFYVRPARDGVDALLAFLHEADKIDMALIDIGLPRLNGLDVLRIMRAMEPSLPVLMITGKMDGVMELETTLFTYGASGFLTKPFQLDRLLAMVRDIAGP